MFSHLESFPLRPTSGNFLLPDEYGKMVCNASDTPWLRLVAGGQWSQDITSGYRYLG